MAVCQGFCKHHIMHIELLFDICSSSSDAWLPHPEWWWVTALRRANATCSYVMLIMSASEAQTTFSEPYLLPHRRSLPGRDKSLYLQSSIHQHIPLQSSSLGSSSPSIHLSSGILIKHYSISTILSLRKQRSVFFRPALLARQFISTQPSSSEVRGTRVRQRLQLDEIRCSIPRSLVETRVRLPELLVEGKK